ncbi:P-loop NTPase fold protein [Pseudomonas siliginis]|uniref:P-loop NTPase fold protein n=1 Tax=Pseudomonas siliginis TaxID=2842346 RepID=UPI002093D5CF|nr:P-loop NTPase fold protein [Pseudomonas siliginis]UST81442.1 KAP family NTPase [Pseudomonas siliginis]
MEHLNQSLDHFFLNDSNVVVIKGEWGVGKTHFWDSYFKDRKEAKLFTQIAYSYVSLFGKNSIEQIQSEIFSCAVKLASDEEIDEYADAVALQNNSVSSYLMDLAGSQSSKVKEAVKKGAGWARKNLGMAKDLPYLNKISSLIDKFGNAFISKYIVCFDDIERKGKGLKIKDLMGLVDELAKRKNCKVVLIFNEKSFDEADDLKQFESYREKVVDVELLYRPTWQNNLDHVFSERDFGWEAAREVVRAFDIVNVRVIKKIKQLYAHHSDFFNAASSTVVHEFNVHAAVLAWAYFSVGTHPSCHEIKARMAGGSWASLLQSKSEGDTQEFRDFVATASDLRLVDSIFIGPIIKYLEQGYPDKSKLLECIKKLEADHHVRRLSSEWNSTWDLYKNSFGDDLNVITGALKTFLEQGSPKNRFGDFLTALDFLEDVGQDVDDVVERFIAEHAEDIKSGWYGSSFDIRNERLKEAFQTVAIEVRVKDIDEVTYRMASKRFWDDEDYSFLKKRTVEDFYSWMKTNPEDLYRKIQNGLFLFKNYNGTGAQKQEYDDFLGTVYEALRKVAGESALNAKRVKDLYGVE